jgi:hypothetical protein
LLQRYRGQFGVRIVAELLRPDGGLLAVHETHERSYNVCEWILDASIYDRGEVLARFPTRRGAFEHLVGYAPDEHELESFELDCDGSVAVVGLHADAGGLWVVWSDDDSWSVFWLPRAPHSRPIHLSTHLYLADAFASAANVFELIHPEHSS